MQSIPRAAPYAAAMMLLLAGAPPAFAGNVWQANRTLQPGDIVQTDDVTALPPVHAVLNAVPASKTVVGLEVKRRIYDGRVLTEQDVGPRAAVKASAMVDVIFREGVLQLAMSGRALEDGGIGDEVRVLNTTTSRTLRGTVVGDDVVEVGTPQ